MWCGGSRRGDARVAGARPPDFNFYRDGFHEPLPQRISRGARGDTAGGPRPRETPASGVLRVLSAPSACSVSICCHFRRVGYEVDGTPPEHVSPDPAYRVLLEAREYWRETTSVPRRGPPDIRTLDPRSP